MPDISSYKNTMEHFGRLVFSKVTKESIDFLYDMVVVNGYSWGYITQGYFYGGTGKLNRLCQSNARIKEIKDAYMIRSDLARNRRRLKLSSL